MRKTKIRIITALVVLALALAALPFGAMADESTTVVDYHVYKDMTPNTQLYVMTDVPGASYPAAGARNEPEGGVLYGRTTQYGTYADSEKGMESKEHFSLAGTGGAVNAIESVDESVISQYISLGREYGLQALAYLSRPALSDGEHTLLVYLNFPNEGEDCQKVVDGDYDAGIIEDMKYMATLECPVFMRVGGEVNCWQKAAEPESFKAAYRHIAALRDEYVPDAALLYSPNFTGSGGSDMDTWYPGDDVVDWIGVSLYYNRGTAEHKASEHMFYGTGDVYGDPVLNVQMAVNLSRLHKKPLMITEGGAANVSFGQTVDNTWVGDRIAREMAFLPLLYPEVKAIVLSDYNPGGNNNYIFFNNDTITSAYRRAVSALGVYRTDYHEAGKYLTPLSDKPDLAADTTGDIRIFAYTYSPEKLTATLYIDGEAVGTSSDYPYAFTVSRDSLLTGDHTVKAVFSNNQAVCYRIADGRVTEEDKSARAELPDSWAQEEVYKAIALGIVPLELQKSYKKDITRGEFAALAVRFYEKLKGTEIEGRKTFKDTDDVNIQKLAYIGVINGYTDGNFGPNDKITREQAATILAHLAEAMGHTLRKAGERLQFSDAGQISDWAYEAVGQVVVNNGIMRGYSDGRGPWGPKDNFTVQQSIMTLLRLVSFVQ